MTPDVGKLVPVDLEGTDELDYMHQEGLALVAQAQALKVVDQATFQDAAEFARNLKAHEKRIQDLMRPIKQTAKAAHEATVAQEKRLLEGPQAAYRVLDREMTEWDRAQRALKAAAEAQAAQEAARLQAEALKTGKPIAPVVVPAKAVEMPSASGISFRSRWVAVVTDKAALVAAVAAGKVTLDVLEVNMPMLNEFARTMKGNLSLPGVIAKEERGMTARADG